MKHKVEKALWLISGIILAFTGLIAMFMGESLSKVTVIWGLAMLISGIFKIVIFGMLRKRVLGTNWILVDGITTTLVAIFLMSHPEMTVEISSVVIPIVFGMWMMFSGMLNIMTAIDYQKIGFTTFWVLILIIGLFSMLFGFLSLFRVIPAAIVVGFILLFHGCFALIQWWAFHKQNN